MYFETKDSGTNWVITQRSKIAIAHKPYSDLEGVFATIENVMLPLSCLNALNEGLNRIANGQRESFAIEY